ncbi:hypothetical protein ACFFOL_14700 [Halobaculum roseum]|uniref:Uncharacterized protein n=1 Tax=Halobaculum roseum TaxID=2175149 RepID=A0ABD5MPL6_9EURY|nr:hypothetical protein [Halobaculum roseum]QZY01757.1 hypothetical protein K6T36_10500 [Halobaculum roseum]
MFFEVFGVLRGSVHGEPRGRAVADGRAFVRAAPSGGMSDKDLLGLVLGGIALLMFATGLILVLQ